MAAGDYAIRICLMISIVPELQNVVRLGVLKIEQLRVEESSEELRTLLKDLAEETEKRYRDVPLGEISTVRKIRTIFHRAGLDPTRYRPSSESLLRRAVKGKGLYFINSVVDLVNYLSLKTLWPMGLYDANRLKPPIALRIGCEGESYQGIGRDQLNLAHFPLLVDREGPFGSPVSDCIRTRVTAGCNHVLWVTFAPLATDIPLDEFSNTMIRFNGGVVTESVQT